MSRFDDVEIPIAGGRRMRAALALPVATDAPAPGVVVLHEILGLNDDIRRIAARFADNGYAALAPDLFQHLGPMPLCIVRAIHALTQGGGTVAEAVVAARDWLAERDDVDGARIGVAGFCMGGGFAVLVAVSGPFQVAAPFYGDVPKRVEALRGICPVVGGYGGRDRVFAPQGARLQDHLRALHVPHDVVIYPDAGHSYMSRRESRVVEVLGRLSPMRAGYDAHAAEDSWARMLAFFARYRGPDAAAEAGG